MTFLLILSFIIFWIIIGNTEREPNWRMALIQTAIIWAGYMILGTEVLGWFHQINKLGLSIFWSLPILGGPQAADRLPPRFLGWYDPGWLCISDHHHHRRRCPGFTAEFRRRDGLSDEQGGALGAK